MSKSSYKKIKKIGEGTYGIVYKGINKETGKIVAIKKIRPLNEDEGIPATTIREIVLLKSLKHPNIIDLIEIIHKNDSIYLIFEYMKTDLKKILDNNTSNKILFNYNQILYISKQLLEGIYYCHSKNIFHRDIKPQNILINNDLRVKLGDFGLARAASNPLKCYTKEIITLWYRPPELLLGATYYDSSVDIWSIGCIMYELYTNRPLFPGESEIDQINKIFSVFGIPKNEDWNNVENLKNYNTTNFTLTLSQPFLLIKHNEFKDILLKMLKYDPIKRINAKELLKYDLFSKLN